MRASRPAPLLVLALALMAAGFVAAGPVDVSAGRKWVKLVGRDSCRGSSGWLGPDVCGGSRGNSLMLKMVAGGPWTTWRMNPVNPADYELANGAAITLQIEGRTKPLPKCGNALNAPNCASFMGAAAGCASTALSMIASNISAARFVLEKVNGTTDQYYMRTSGRSTCAKRYLGAAYKANVRGCGNAQLGLHTKDEADTHTRWQIIPVPALPPCPSPPPPPSPSPPPPAPSPPAACKLVGESCTDDCDCCGVGVGVACSTFSNTCGFT